MPLDQVGVEEFYVHVGDKAVVDTFNSKINNMHTGKNASKLLHPALVLFSEKYLQEFFFDVKLEACVICSAADAEAFLITDDHQFFRFFLKSKVVQEFLRGGVTKCWGIPLP